MQGNTQVSAVRQVKTWQLVEPNIVGKEILHACRELTELVVGKTTLAQKIYNDNKIKTTFSKRAWICISQEYSEIDILKQILRNVEVQYQPSETLGELAEKLELATQNKSFFLVLDDVWKHEVWTNLLKTPFGTAAATIVLVTTRNDLIAQKIDVQYTHALT